jgi:signal transduction histidine kinase
LVIIRDIAEQKRLEKEVLNISAVEQMRIGQDLHDSLGQDLTGIAFMARYLQETLAEQSKSEAMLAADIGKFISQAIKKVRALSRDLLQPELDMSSLVPALTDLVANVSKMFNVSCEFRAPDRMMEIPLNSAVHLYRIVQEAISNAIKHGKASKIVVSLEQVKHQLILNVFNNGSDCFGSVAASKGMGLRIMHYRARTIGATLNFHQVDRGVRLTCCLSNNSPKV